jgi:S-adenosylmethionine:tRNA ribosyltransferase-isomerase
MRTDELDFNLPPELIAQIPPATRSESRLLHYNRGSRALAHRRFSELPELLRAGDLLIFNDSRVVPARLLLKKDTGGRVEGLFLREIATGEWDVLLRDVGAARLPMPLHFPDAPEVPVRITDSHGGGTYRLQVGTIESALALLERLGRMPLPPYIKRQKDHDERDAMDRDRYQTVYARDAGSVAAPTAGLHFTPELFDRLDHAGVERRFVTLHVGMGTFKPITSDTLEGHAMHSEAYTIPPETADAVNRAKTEKRRIIAVGTTAARVLESLDPGPISSRSAETSIFIHPPYRWKHVTALVTNFHLPRSTLIALVGAFVSLEEQRRIYHQAIEQRYRFFSYGDAMLVE